MTHPPTLNPVVVREWCLWVPLPPSKLGAKPKWMNLNERAHWGSRSGKTSVWRTSAAETALKAASTHGIPRLEEAWVVAHFSFGDGRRRDVHNYLPTVKACIDGFTDAGLWEDDCDGVLTGPDLRRMELREISADDLSSTPLKGIHFCIREVIASGDQGLRKPPRRNSALGQRIQTD